MLGVRALNILFVCTGNTCRSPMAEAILRKKYPQWKVKSAGVFAASGSPASPEALEALREKNMLFDHRSQPLTDELLDWADLILTMTSQHKQLVTMDFPDYHGKIFALKEFVSHSEEAEALRAQIEDKRRRFIADHPKLSAEELENQLEEHVKADYKKLVQLEAAGHSLDISDPFGGDIELYRVTRDELEKQIDRLIKKIGPPKGE